MSFPASLTTRTITGRFVTYPDGAPAEGNVVITLNDFMQGPSDDTFVAPFSRSFNFDQNGEISVVLPATDDPHWTPSSYKIVINVLGGKPPLRRTFSVPYDSTGDLDLTDLLNLPAPTPGQSYILLASKGVPGGVATLDENGLIPSSQIPAGTVDISWSDVSDKPSTFPPSSHAHAFAEITDKPDLPTRSEMETADLAVLGLAEDALEAGQNALTGLATKADLVGGVIPTAQIPAIAVTEFLGISADQPAMLAKTGQKGDWTIRFDLGQAWVITGDNPTQLASWTAMPLGTSPVQTVNGQVGTVVLGKADVGLPDVDNTTDANKPISTAMATALAGKLPLSGPEIVDDFIVIRKGNGSSAMRIRATGEKVDYDLYGDVILGTWSGAGFTGSQFNLLRWRGDGTTFAGKTNFSNDIYGDQQWIDNGVGAKFANLEVTGTLTGVTPAKIGLAAPSDNNFAGWTFPSDQVQAATILPTAGLSYVVRFRVMTATVSAILIHITTAGNTLTNAFATLHTDAGVYIPGAVTADQSTLWTSGGLKTMALTTPATGLTPGAYYKVRFWVGSATTLPTFSRATNSSSAIINAGLVAPNFKYATADAGLTTVALAPTTIGAMTGGPTAWWVAVAP